MLMTKGLSKSFKTSCFVSFSERMACSVGIFQSIPRVSIKIFVLNSHKDKGGKKTASRTTRLPRLFIMIRLSKVRRICCYKTIFSYISFTFCHGFAVVPCNSGRNLCLYICLFHHANQVRFFDVDYLNLYIRDTETHCKNTKIVGN